MPNDPIDMVNSEDPSTATPASSSVARPPLRRWTVLAFALLVLASTTAASVLLWHWVDDLTFVDADKKSTAHLDVLKLTASIAVGGGGLFALYLAARRQRTQELELAQRERVQAHAVDVQAHAEQVAQDNREDAAARRVTELYAKSVEQLGSDKAAVRLGGLYALERLAQGNTDQQSTVGNVLCAYLRMPHPRPHPLPEEATAEQREAHELTQAQYIQERETRQTALDILTRHHPEHKTLELRWPAMRIRLQRADLTEVNLIGADLAHADLTDADLNSAILIDAILTDANLTHANLANANLANADLTDANLTHANLNGAILAHADLAHANLTHADLNSANLTHADLNSANLANANLTHANLNGADLTHANHTDNTVVVSVVVGEKTRGTWW